MNIFESHEGFSGRFDPDSTGGTLLSLLTLAGDIRLKLGRQGYLLDSYLTLFLEGANAMLAYEAGSDGFERGGELRSLCFDVLDRDGEEKDHLFYDTALNTLIARMDMIRYQERQTRMNLLYATLADEFLLFAVKHFLREAESRIGDGCDIPKLMCLYRRISEVVGEPLMETLNLRLKQRFLIVPIVPVFVQGATNDLLYCLLNRDSETDKQVFQLLIDSVNKP
ncbi:hypothetical protein LI291_09195 [Intestinibacillus massiliensis]|nr:hypothetical protein [Intestinibacillus massiliensis]